MPVDSRRLQGPETAFSYTLIEQEDGDEMQTDEKGAIIDDDGSRRDKRKAIDARPMFLKTGVVSQAKGSAYVELNNTKVICSVYGPREVQKKSDFSLNGQLFCEFKFAPFSCKNKRGHQQDNEELEISRLLRESLSAAVCLYHFPKAQVEVYVIVIEDDGSALAASLTCASLALANASIPMYDLVIGASVRMLPGTLLLDPTKEEEWISTINSDENNGNLIVGYMPSLEQVCAYIHEGVSNAEQLDKVLQTAIGYCRKVEPAARKCLKDNVEQILKEETERESAE